MVRPARQREHHQSITSRRILRVCRLDALGTFGPGLGGADPVRVSSDGVGSAHLGVGAQFAVAADPAGDCHPVFSHLAPAPSNLTPGRHALGIRRFLPVWLVVVGVATAASLMRQVVAGEPSDPVGHASLAMLIESSGWVVPIFVLLVTLAVPWLEEVAFRGFLQPALSRLLGSARWGVVLTAGLFAAAHLGAVQWDGLPGLFVLGLGLGILRDQTGRIESAVVVHVLFNLLNIVLTWISTSASV